MSAASKVLVAAVAATLLAAASAIGAPPSAVDEYTEAMPGFGGDQPSTGNGGDRGSPPDPPALTPAALAALEQRGTEGAATAALLESTASGRGAGADSLRGAGAIGAPTGDFETDGTSPLAAVVDQATGSDDGIGVALPIILGLGFCAALGFGLTRRRTGSPPSS